MLNCHIYRYKENAKLKCDEENGKRKKKQRKNRLGFRFTFRYIYIPRHGSYTPTSTPTHPFNISNVRVYCQRRGKEGKEYRIPVAAPLMKNDLN